VQNGSLPDARWQKANIGVQGRYDYANGTSSSELMSDDELCESS